MLINVSDSTSGNYESKTDISFFVQKPNFRTKYLESNFDDD